MPLHYCLSFLPFGAVDSRDGLSLERRNTLRSFLDDVGFDNRGKEMETL